MSTTDGDASVRLVITGHIDHGKSTLIGRLLFDTDSLPAAVADKIAQAGFDEAGQLAFIADHLKEERQQERTIDTTQIFFHTPQRRYVVIDTPGHAEFIKNMFTGASRADAAVLIVDATESVQMQTVAHCHVLALLGVGHVIALVNKMDRVEYGQGKFAEVAAAVGAVLGKLGLTPRAVIPISARQGDNVARRSDRLAWYSGPTMLEALADIALPASQRDQPLRFAVQDRYDVEGKQVYVGRVEAGVLTVGQQVRLLPGAQANVLQSVEVFDKQRTSAEAGESVGVTFARPVAGDRGLIVCDPGSLAPVSAELSGRLFWMSEQPLRLTENLEIRIATQEAMGRVESLRQRFHSSSPQDVQAEAAELCYGQIALVRLSAGSPLVTEPFTRGNALGRFVLTRAGNVVGAGTVV